VVTVASLLKNSFAILKARSVAVREATLGRATPNRHAASITTAIVNDEPDERAR
jgi:hypothetical protein